MNDSSSELEFPWNELGLAPTHEVGEIQRAYARRLKTLDLSSEREAFRALRRAYEAALIAAAGETGPEPETAEEGPTSEATPAPPPCRSSFRQRWRCGCSAS